MIESMRMRCAKGEAHMGQMGYPCRILQRKAEGKNLISDIVIDGKILLKRILTS
jgi:hypothetical protein